jgi:hypothetical protein
MISGCRFKTACQSPKCDNSTCSRGTLQVSRTRPGASPHSSTSSWRRIRAQSQIAPSPNVGSRASICPYIKSWPSACSVGSALADQDEGAELPLDRGAGGHILTAYTTGSSEFYENVRTAGFYISMGERNPQAAAVAVPVFGVQHQFMGALGVIAALSRTDQARAEEIRDILLSRAAGIVLNTGRDRWK